MKKLLGLILALTILSSCLSLVGCNVFGELLGTTGTEKRIAPSERDPILDELELDYSEDFTKFDIEFIKHMYERNLRTFPPVNDYEKRPDFCNHMEQLSIESNTFYKINVDLQCDVYFIAVYGAEGTYITQLGGCVDQVKWKKYDSYDSIPQILDGEILLSSYAVYDCVIEKDVINDVTYNYACKYYLPLIDGYYSIENNPYYYGLYDTVLWCDAYGLLGRSTPTTILHTLFFFEDMTKDMYEYYVDENGVEYIVLTRVDYPYYRGGTSPEITNEELKSLIITNEDLYVHYYENGKIANTLEKYCLPISAVVDICWKK